jgi:hypothetical protein
MTEHAIPDEMAVQLIRRLWPHRHEHPFMRQLLRTSIQDLRLFRKLHGISQEPENRKETP